MKAKAEEAEGWEVRRKRARDRCMEERWRGMVGWRLEEGTRRGTHFARSGRDERAKEGKTLQHISSLKTEVKPFTSRDPV